MNNKGRKTTIIAIVAGIMIIALIVAMYMKIISADELWKGIPIIGTAAALFIGFFSKDQTASHTKDFLAGGGGELPPDDEDPPPPG